MIDHVNLLERLDKLAGVCRRFGFTGLPPAGKNLLKPLIGNRLSVRVEGFDITGTLAHRHYLQGLRRSEVEPVMANLFASVIRRGMVVLDIGAFVGWYTLLAARQVGAHGIVYAFEPDPRNYERLSENLRLNRVDPCVIRRPNAVSHKTGVQRFFLHGGDQSRSSLIPSGVSDDSILVTSVVLDDFRPKLRPDVIKMDIEGGEVNALRGMRETLTGTDRPLKLFIECNPGALQQAGESAQSLLAELHQLGFAILMIDEVSRGLKPVDSRVETAKYINLFCVRA